MRLEAGPLVAASDASEAAGAAVYSTGLSPQGELLAARAARALNPACEEGVALASVFSGIDGARPAFEIFGVAPARHLPFETDADAARVARRAFPSTSRTRSTSRGSCASTGAPPTRRWQAASHVRDARCSTSTARGAQTLYLSWRGT